MTCPGDGTTGLRRIPWLFRNWARTNVYSIPTQFNPTTVQHVVAAVQEVERIGGIVRALGSGWSFTDVALTREVSHVIDTTALARVLSGSDMESTATVLPFALSNTARAESRFFVHVEAGIKIHDLNCRLNSLGLAMPTLGGSNGQSLAGVISTGTHGSDVDLRPIADFVRAIHLVGPGGQEWWIEPATDPITDRTRMESLRTEGRLLCNSMRIEYDDQLFNAVLVSAGRMGVIYSVVLKAVNAFRLRETRQASNWETIRSEVRSVIINAGDTYGGPRFMEIVLSPYRDGAGVHPCVVTRRVLTDEALTPDPPPQPDVFGMLCRLEPLTPILHGLMALIPALIAAATGAALLGISWMLAIPFVGGLLYAAASTAVVAAATTTLIALQTALISFLTTPGENIAQKLANIVNLAVAVGQKQIVPQLINQMITFIRNPAQGPVVGESFRIMTGQAACGQPWQDTPNCMREIDGLEFALDITPGRENLFLFLNDIFALTDEFFAANRPPGFGLSLRFTRGTRALIGMQRFARTCSVEFIMLRGFRGHNDFIQRTYAIARRHGAIPHWGLIHDLTGSEVFTLYGARHTDWRLALGRLIDTGGGRTGTFSTSFSLRRDLEPLAGCVVPRGVVALFRRILLALARSRGMRDAMGKKPDKKP